MHGLISDERISRMPEYITVKEWASRHGVPTWKVRRLVKAGLLRHKPPSELLVEDVEEPPKAKRGRPRKSK